MNEKKLRDNAFVDPMQSYDDYLLEEAQKSKRARNKLAARQITQSTSTKSEENVKDNVVHENKTSSTTTLLSVDELEARFRNKNNIIHYY